MSVKYLRLVGGGALASLLFFLAFCLPAASADGPRGCVQEIAESVAKSDAGSFARLVDIESIAKDAFVELESAVREPDLARRMPPALLTLLTQGAFTSPFLQPALIGELRNFVLEGVANGSFAGTASGRWRSNQSVLGPLLADASKGKKEICNVGRAVNVANGTWLVPFDVRDANGSTYHVSGGVKRIEGGSMRLCYIDNIQDVMRQVLK